MSFFPWKSNKKNKQKEKDKEIVLNHLITNQSAATFESVGNRVGKVTSSSKEAMAKPRPAYMTHEPEVGNWRPIHCAALQPQEGPSIKGLLMTSRGHA